MAGSRITGSKIGWPDPSIPLTFTSHTLFFWLQIADAVTTIVFLTLGVNEGNPLVKFAMTQTGPVAGLVLVKVMAVLLGLYCARSERFWALGKINLTFLLVVTWNVSRILTVLRQA